jgi:hypothetical protein
VAVQRDIKKVEIPIFKSQISVSPENTIPIQFRIKTEDGTKISAWSNVYEIAGPAVIANNIVTMVNKVGATKKVLLSWDDESNANLYDIFVYRFQNLNIRSAGSGSASFTKTATVATVQLFSNKGGTGTRREHGLKVGMSITVSLTSPDFDRVGTTVTEVVDPYTFKYSPVPTATVVTTPFVQDDFDIVTTTSQTTTLSLNDYVYVDTTDRTSYNLSKPFTIKTSDELTTISATSTHMFARVQVASSNKKPNSLLTVGFANVATP